MGVLVGLAVLGFVGYIIVQGYIAESRRGRGLSSEQRRKWEDGAYEEREYFESMREYESLRNDWRDSE